MRQRFIMLGALVALISTLFFAGQRDASALQAADVVINEIVAANDSYVDNFGATPDWIELQNNGSSSANLLGWTISDGGNVWVFPSYQLNAGARVVVFASNFDVTSPRLHTNFSLRRLGETVSLADPNGVLADSVTYPELDDDQAYGRDSSGTLGYLITATPEAANSDLAPSPVSIATPAQSFIGSLQVTIDGAAGPDEQVRYTTNSSAVTSSSPVYSGPFTITTSTVVRAAAVRNGVVGQESTAGYIAISSSIASFTSDLPIVMVHSTGAVGTSVQDAIVTVIDTEANGRPSVFGPADYNGFAGLKIRGASSSNFPKKQYKLELWGDRFDNEVDADLLGLGAESDWVLYAPGRYDRALINNPFMYELGKRIGTLAPDYQFVELYIEDNATATVGDGDYLGIYVLRENIKVGDNRVDIVEHTPSSAGDEGGYIFRYDWSDSCCTNLEGHPEFGSRIAVDTPGAADLTSTQLSYAQSYWNSLQAAANNNFAAADALIDFDSLIDSWLLNILALDVDVLRASHYFHKDAGGQLQGGPLWDFDRSLGSADSRSSNATGWKPGGSNASSGHAYDSDIYAGLWEMPEVQARLRSRWAQLRSGELSTANINALIDAFGAELSEAYVREDNRWGSTSGYGSRFGGLTGELNNMKTWLATRTTWLDQQFAPTSSPPVITPPADSSFEIDENTAFSYQVIASDPQPMLYAATGLPDGLAIDETSGLITGTIAYGDGGPINTVEITVSDSTGASSSISVTMQGISPLGGNASALLLNEFNAVGPGRLLANDGTDVTFGRVSGNGGDWFELVTIDDNLDLRGWRFDLWSNNISGDVAQTASLVLGQNSVLADIRSGSIITVAESVAEDLSYDPGQDDWTLNLQSNNLQDGTVWANQTSFDTNNTKWRLVVRDSNGAVRALIAGETVPFEDQPNNVGDNEVFTLDVDPAPTVQDMTPYNAGSQSSFGEPNPLSGGGIQDLSALRPQLFVLGDVNCSDTAPDISDALAIAQYTVGTRTDSGGCPLADPTAELNLAAADVNNDESADITDALLIAQCTVGVSNVLCP